jgi:hypothetical protein
VPIRANIGKLPSWPTLERSPELVKVVVIVPGKAGHPVGESQASPARVDPDAVPLRRRERFQEAQHLGSPPLKGGEGLTGIIAQVLPVLGPAVGVERVPDRAADPPGRQVVRARPEDEDARLVDRQYGVEADLEELLDVTDPGQSAQRCCGDTPSPASRRDDHRPLHTSPRTPFLPPVR